jgi:hypothetical protein
VTYFWVLSDFLSSRDNFTSLGIEGSDPVDKDSLVKVAASGDTKIASSGLWMLLLLRLEAVVLDERFELRNSKSEAEVLL